MEVSTQNSYEKKTIRELRKQDWNNINSVYVQQQLYPESMRSKQCQFTVKGFSKTFNENEKFGVFLNHGDIVDANAILMRPTYLTSLGTF